VVLDNFRFLKVICSYCVQPHEKQSSEISLKTAVEENETESKMMKEVKYKLAVSPK